MEEIWGTVFIISLIIGVIPAAIANSKGKDFFTWYIYGVSLFFFAMIHAIVLPEKKIVDGSKQKDSNQTLLQAVAENSVPIKIISVPDFYREPQLVDLCSPVDVESYTLRIPRGVKNVFVDITFRNLSNKLITALKIKILTFDAFNEPVNNNGSNVLEKNVQDIEGSGMSPRSIFGGGLIELQGFEDARKIQVVVKSVLFSDGTRWDYDESKLININLKPAEGSDLGNLKVVAGEGAISYAIDEKVYWLCVCGKANLPDHKTCRRCERIKAVVLSNCSSKRAVDNEFLRLRQNKEEEERLNSEEEQKRKETNSAMLKKVAAFTFTAAILLTTAGLITFLLIIPQYKYNKAVAFIEEKDYVRAITILRDIRTYKNSDELYKQSNHEQALIHLDLGNYEIAIKYFEKTNGYKNSKAMLLYAKDMLVIHLTGADYYIDYENGTIPIGNLPIGTVVVDASWQWEFRTENDYTSQPGDETKPVTWIVVAKDHYGLGSGVTLLSDELIGLHAFYNSTTRGSDLGSNHWGDSGTPNATRSLRLWLNSTGIHSREGFYQAFSESFKEVVLETTLPNREWENGNAYNTKDYVFIPSTTELGDSAHDSTYPIGSTYSYFTGAGNEKRVAFLGGKARSYRTRSPAASRNGLFVRYVGDNTGQFYSDLYIYDSFAVRPALNLKSEILVSEIRN